MITLLIGMEFLSRMAYVNAKVVADKITPKAFLKMPVTVLNRYQLTKASRDYQ
jgi:hypothetical protein